MPCQLAKKALIARKEWKAGGEEMKSSFDYWSMEQMLSNNGFLIYEILEPKDIQTRIIGKRGMKAFEHINYVQAVIKKNG